MPWGNSPLIYREWDESVDNLIVFAPGIDSDGNFAQAYYVMPSRYADPPHRIEFQKISPDGEKLWEEPRIIGNTYVKDYSAGPEGGLWIYAARAEGYLSTNDLMINLFTSEIR